MKIDWKRKLTSRKFWAAVVGFVTALLLGFGCSDSTAAEVTSIIMSSATLIAYIIGEGIIDAESVGVEDTYFVDTYEGEENESQ